MPSKEKNYKANGERVRKLRVMLGISRPVMAKRLGMEPGSYKLVELGYGNLGRKKLELVERWEKGDLTGYNTHTASDSGEAHDGAEPWRTSLDPDIETMTDLLLDKEAASKIAGIATLTGCDLRTAARKFIEINLEKKRKGQAS